MDEGYKTHFVDQVQRVVAGCSVGSYTYVDAFFKHFGNWSKSVSELHVTGRVCYNAYIVFFQNVHIIVVDLNTVSCNKRIFKKTGAFCKFNGAATIIFPAVFNLGHTFGQMHMYAHVLLRCFFCDDLKICFIAGVGSMRPQPEGESVTVFESISF